MGYLKNNYFYLIIGLTIAAFFSFFLFETINYTLIKDDVWYKNLLSGKGILNAATYIYLEVNGRWFSHLWDCFVFKLFQNHYQLFFIYHLFLLICFISALSEFVSIAFQKLYSIALSSLKTILASISLTALFFFLFFEGREEVWYWVCATGVHLLSLIALLFVVSYCIKDKLKTIELIFLIACAMAIGGMSESYAIMSMVILLLGVYKRLLVFKRTVSITSLIFLSLLVNILSSGLQSRLSMLPDFNLALALRNTLHSLLLPFIYYQYLPLKTGTLIITYLLAIKVRSFDGIQKKEFMVSHFLKQSGMVIAVITLSFFIPCFLLTDITAYRMESFGYLFFLLFVFDYSVQYG